MTTEDFPGEARVIELGGTLPVLPTPFWDGEVDYASLGRLLEFVLTDCDGCTLLGSTGEAPSLTLAERATVAEFAMRNLPAGKQLVVGVAHTSARDALELARHAQSIGAAAVLVPAPYYFVNSVQGIRDFLHVLGAQLEIDMILYDNPYSTKTVLSELDIQMLAEALPRLAGVKVTDHSIDKIPWLKRHTGLRVFAGEDALIFRSLLMGCDGAMVICPSVFPAAYRQVWERIRAGRPEAALDLFSRRVLPFVHMFGLGNEIAATKAIFQYMGLFRSAQLRPPLTAVDETFARHLAMAYRAAAGDRPDGKGDDHGR